MKVVSLVAERPLEQAGHRESPVSLLMRGYCGAVGIISGVGLGTRWSEPLAFASIGVNQERP
jgi:hypothetical protein